MLVEHCVRLDQSRDRREIAPQANGDRRNRVGEFSSIRDHDAVLAVFEPSL